MDKSQIEYMKGLERLLEDGEYSDFVIQCQGLKYNVHKAVVCTQSDFFGAACSWPGGGSSRTIKRQRRISRRFSGVVVEEDVDEEVPLIDLDDDDPVAVWAMVQYLYRMKYSSLTGGLMRKVQKRARRQAEGDQTEEQYEDDNSRLSPWRCLHQHAKIYSLAEKYSILGLKYFVEREFRERMERRFRRGTDDFIQCVTEIYTGTPDEDRGLRDIVKPFIQENMHLIREKEMRSLLMDIPSIAVDVLMDYCRRTPQNEGA